MKFTQIETIHLPDHYYLRDDDICIFYGEYTARRGFGHSETNSLISNLKKEMDRLGRPEWRYKQQAINQCATLIRNGINPQWLSKATLVPVPPSKLKTDPMYDDRIVQILERINPPAAYDIRELIVQTTSRDPMHTSGRRYSPEELMEMYEVDTSLIEPRPEILVIVDDMLTSGTHFRAIKTMLEDKYGNLPVVGIFIARRVPESDFLDEVDFSALFDQ